MPDINTFEEMLKGTLPEKVNGTLPDDIMRLEKISFRTRAYLIALMRCRGLTGFSSKSFRRLCDGEPEYFIVLSFRGVRFFFVAEAGGGGYDVQRLVPQFGGRRRPA